MRDRGIALACTLESLRLILDKSDSPKQFGVCIDTCHLFSSGYDLRTKDGVDKVIEKFKEIVGIKELKVYTLMTQKAHWVQTWTDMSILALD